MTLTEIGKKYGTDKATYHGFTDFYEERFHKLMFRPRTILEIGIKDGASLRMWHEYFPNAVVIGVDINPRFDIMGVCTFESDATKRECLDLFHSINFDLIIDDGSHMTADQQATFLLFIKKLRNGGIYIMEDTHSSYLSAYCNAPINTVDWLTGIVAVHYNVEFWQKDLKVNHDSATCLITYK